MEEIRKPHHLTRDQILAPQARQTVWVLGYPNANLLDMSGPFQVFSAAQHLAAEFGIDDLYSVELVAKAKGPLPSDQGLTLQATKDFSSDFSAMDSLIVCGGAGRRQALKDRETLAWLTKAAAAAGRVGSVCTGAYLLAEIGALDGRTTTTHWRWAEDLQQRYQGITLEPDAIFMRHGKLWSSAGVSAGMDMALAMVELDHGPDLALAVARELVLFLKRPGGQSQFSTPLRAETSSGGRIQELQHWIAGNITADLSVVALAARAGMSPRNFARAFARDAGETPGRFVESVRLEAARRRLEQSSDPVEQVAAAAGFSSAEIMRRAFVRNLGVSPNHYRGRFRSAAKLTETV
ncbi:GlxA family transcriptional regulator [Pelagibius litoralis]|uniref:GlxA family transcriptional regulator n=1 Tax=Pelagibius litoralis TaxID=374515 RepID=A0A967F1G6_9PROT|nr:GlxA family transcriptional regulator [Pelagibius litoralis]NIA71211.1 GlxA family transcriptional regulator [Pelagibius litoralis]